jgi:protein-S-isoprenylcysteine O-methyltransferase Ste14
MLVYLILSSLLNSYLLLRRSSTPKRTPDNWLELVVPLVATFGIMASSLLIDLVPKSVDRLLIPDAYRGFSTVVGGLIVFFGLVISLTAEWHLNTSYGVFVQVREPVMTGMYAYVRHPMYASYFFVNFGIFLLYPMVSYALCSLFFVSVLVFRARLEEAKLSDYSEEYRLYKERTPMIIPRLWRTGVGK